MGFERSALDVKTKILGLGGFQMGDLAGKTGRVIGAEHKHNKLILYGLLKHRQHGGKVVV